MRNWLTDTFDLSVPLVGAPMANAGSGRLAAAVSAAGALGMFGVGNAAAPDWVREQCRVAAGSRRAYGVGLMAWALEQDRSALEAVIGLDPDEQPSLVSVSFGDFARFLGPLRDHGILTATQVGNLDEARRAAAAGVDLIVARGAEGGGHGRNEVGTLPLLEMVLAEVDRPVVAAGGISGARGLAAVLAAGALGAWVGTAFLACTEADTSDAARARLFAGTETSYGRVFDVAQRLGWPEEYGGRALRNEYFDRWADRIEELAEDDAAAAELAAAKSSGDFDTAYIYAGQGAALLREQHSAADVVAEFGRAEDLLRSAVSD